MKAKALDIHDQFDKNDDGRVSLEEAAEGIKSKLGFGEEEESDSKSLFQYVKDLYQKYIGSGKKKDLALSGDDFTDIIYEWKAQCSAKHDKEELWNDHSHLYCYLQLCSGIGHYYYFK